ncbi:hypothetical protein [Komagataeibacter xylinus]|uniref:Uncharacterized protein n=1 Tax=Komagataeibacter xylinus TaxID=28448 RepID=A0A857FVC9_KOMXY|nr:hypothetical protein [Komagataeibacter xylinus]QHC37430.1 hypothetical protein FMA36_17810 [Komagataeibacter xylinus]
MMNSRYHQPLVPSWYASPQPVWKDESIFPTKLIPLADMTVRQRVRLGYGGRAPRLLLSNAYGHESVHIDAISCALAADSAEIDPKQRGTITVAGSRSIVLPPGATVLTDPVDLVVNTGDVLSVSMYFAQAPTINSFHWEGRSTAYLLPGQQVDAICPKATATTTVRLFLASVLVEAPSRGTIVAFGDSITDGAGASLDADTRWPAFWPTGRLLWGWL